MIYVIVFKESKEILTPESFKEYWKDYGKNSLYGWKAPKKVYYTLGSAKSGFNYIPEELKSKLEIAEFTFNKTILDGEELAEQQSTNKTKRKQVKQKQQLLRQKQSLQRQADSIQKQLSKFED